MLENYPDVLTISDIVGILNIGKNSAYKLIQTNRLHHIRVGRNIRIPKQSLKEYLLNNDKNCYNQDMQSATSFVLEVNTNDR